MDQHKAVSSHDATPPPSREPSLVLMNHLATASNDQVEYRIAKSRNDFAGAYELLQRRYCEAGLSAASGQPMRVLPYHLWPRTQVFIALHRKTVIGTVSLVDGRQPHGVPMEQTYPQTIARLRDQGTLFGEVCSLCVESQSGESTGHLFGELTRLMMFHARSAGIDVLVAVVHPRHAKFYQRAMGFQTIGDVKRYVQAAGQPGIPILGQVNDQSVYRSRWRRYYFEGNFTAADLSPHTLSESDRAYFSQYLAPPQSGLSQSRAA